MVMLRKQSVLLKLVWLHYKGKPSRCSGIGLHISALHDAPWQRQTASHAIGVTSRQHQSICKVPENGAPEASQLLLSEFKDSSTCWMHKSLQPQSLEPENLSVDAKK